MATPAPAQTQAKPAPAKTAKTAQKVKVNDKIQKIERKAPAKKTAQKGKKAHLKFVVDCTNPVNDGIMDVAAFVSTKIHIVQLQNNFF